VTFVLKPSKIDKYSFLAIIKLRKVALIQWYLYGIYKVSTSCVHLFSLIYYL